MNDQAAEVNADDARPNKLLVAVATFTALVASAALAQAMTFSLFRVATEWNTSWTPGLFTVIVTSWMVAACASWASWRRWIALPVAGAVILSVALVAVPLSQGNTANLASSQSAPLATNSEPADPATVVGTSEYCRAHHERADDLMFESNELAILASRHAGVFLWSPIRSSSDDAAANAVAAEYYGNLGGWEVYAELNAVRDLLEQHCP